MTAVVHGDFPRGWNLFHHCILFCVAGVIGEEQQVVSYHWTSGCSYNQV
jgi:hypothetical protein